MALLQSVSWRSAYTVLREPHLHPSAAFSLSFVLYTKLSQLLATFKYMGSFAAPLTTFSGATFKLTVTDLNGTKTPRAGRKEDGNK